MERDRDFIATIKKCYSEQVAPFHGSPLGCSYEEVALAEARLQITFPLAYKQFLYWAGKKNAGVFARSSIELDSIVGKQGSVETYFEYENDGIDNFPMAKNKFVFLVIEQFMGVGWFNLPPENDDPCIYYVFETNACFFRPSNVIKVFENDYNTIVKCDSFTSYILDEVEQSAITCKGKGIV